MGIFEPTHLIILLVIVLLLFGGKKIPELMRGVGKGVGELQKGLDEGKRSFQASVENIKEMPEEHKDDKAVPRKEEAGDTKVT